ncbi:unnamed protein product [Brachionus calyciflorus]|uniref:Uncharacterized protein n=1 Tax=Brachionus calyciflorus TaxID=104777 RepID=A0A813ZG55_9BILA|nr:unnamed protein product [Brachionus calyciflorus]
MDFLIKQKYFLSQFSYSIPIMNGVFYYYPSIYYPSSCNYISSIYQKIRSYRYYYILLNNEFEFDHNIIGLEFHASEAGSFTFELGSISCYLWWSLSSCLNIFENYDGSYFGKNIIYFGNRVNVLKDRFVQISFSSGKLGSISGTRKQTIRYFRHPCYNYYESDFPFNGYREITTKVLCGFNINMNQQEAIKSI